MLDRLTIPILIIWTRGRTHISVMKQLYVVTRTIYQTGIAALLVSWVTNTPSVKILCPQKEA